jgi:hypothetical protein
MIDKFSTALALMREAFEDATAGALFIPSVELAGGGGWRSGVINAACAAQALRVAQYKGREQEQEQAQDQTSAWVEVDHGVGHVGEFAADCFGPVLSMGPVAAGRKVATAAVLASSRMALYAATAELNS